MAAINAELKVKSNGLCLRTKKSFSILQAVTFPGKIYDFTTVKEPVQQGCGDHFVI